MRKLLKFSPVGSSVVAPIIFPSESGSIVFRTIGSEVEVTEKQFSDLLKDAEFKGCIDTKQIIAFDVKENPIDSVQEKTENVVDTLDEVIKTPEQTTKKVK